MAMPSRTNVRAPGICMMNSGFPLPVHGSGKRES